MLGFRRALITNTTELATFNAAEEAVQIPEIDQALR
jgi:hypothetical protein